MAGGAAGYAARCCALEGLIGPQNCHDVSLVFIASVEAVFEVSSERCNKKTFVMASVASSQHKVIVRQTDVRWISNHGEGEAGPH